MKKIIAFLCVLCVISGHSSATYMPDYEPCPVTCIFSDLPGWYHEDEAICEFYLSGVLAGADKFRPDDKIRYSEAITMLERVFGVKPVCNQWADWSTDVYSEEGPLALTWVMDYTKEASVNDLFLLLFKASNADVASANGSSTSQPRTPIFRDAAFVYKLIPERMADNQGMTRLEFAHVLYNVQKNGINGVSCLSPLRIKDHLYSYGYGANTPDVTEVFDYAMNNLPASVRDEYIRKNYKIIVVSENTWNKRFGREMMDSNSFAGVTFDDTDTIWIRESNFIPRTIIHELGHFVHLELSAAGIKAHYEKTQKQFAP